MNFPHRQPRCSIVCPDDGRIAPLAAVFLLITLSSCSSRSPSASPAVLSPPVTASTAIVSTEPWTFESAEGRLIRTRHYRLFTTETDPHLRDALPVFLERAFNHYTTAITPLPTPDLKLDTFLMADRAQWQALTRHIMGIHAGPYLRIQRGGFASGGRALLFTIGHRDTLAIAAHEGWHQYTQRTFKHELPVWLEEGLAAYMEGFIPDPSDIHLPLFRPWANPERFEQLAGAATSGRLIPLSRLLDISPASLLASDTDLALTYYAQTWALVHFLVDLHAIDTGLPTSTPATRAIDRGLPSSMPLTRILQDAAAGNLRQAIDRRHGPGASQLLARERRGGEAFTTYFTPDLSTAEHAYAAYVQAIVRGSKDRILAGQRPFD